MTMTDDDLGVLPDEAPVLDDPPDTTVILPAGYIDNTGRREQRATVRELTGEDEERIAKAAKSKNPIDYVDALLIAGTETLGPGTATPALLESLLIGDRDTLLLAIRRATYGDHLVFREVTCPACDAVFDTDIDLAEEVPIKESDGVGPIPVALRNGTALIRPATGRDQRAVYDLGLEATVPQMNTTLIACCLLELDGEEVATLPDEPETVARKLGLKDRDTILEALMAAQPGPKYEEVKVSCPSCSKEYPLTLGVVDLFRP